MLRSKKAYICFLAVILSVITVSGAYCAEKVRQYIPDESSAVEGMTLWQTLVSGGGVMIVLALLSIAAMGLVIYYFLTIKPERLLPNDFLERSLSLIEERNYEGARKECAENDNLISNVFFAGVLRVGRESAIIKEAMQDEGRRRADSLWQKLSYLADIAAIAPMIGLLGTVLGMIQAFNVIAFQTGAVKPILLASGISKAMVTTAAGLIIAIPSMIFYSFFRGRVQDIIAQLENISIELCNLIIGKEGN